MKSGEGIGKVFHGQVADEAVERAERVTNFSGVPFILYGIEAFCSLNEAHRTPEGPVGVHPTIPPILRVEYARHIPAAPTADGIELQPSLKVPGHGAHIPHEQLRLMKHPCIDSLQDKALSTLKIPLTPVTKGGTHGLIFIVHGCRPGMAITFTLDGYQEGIMDMTAPILLDLHQAAR
jgi:hypothetical protein